ncbi:MAG: Hydrolase, alpha/beta fold family [uncultured Friedmanniella sp.]|uniref:Hydrolase, alpha/beta fold family n=1 Tax=uncultured Friedmanniella sp. TaxID=335381 RepID=A0A6J4JZS5_9ACTN|nr:alpha/beta fold hydrolase [uncultured Friedmanniella sp.]CAA9291815.1 MAG: Hydrolase, alpha/beta fold family [uncultured Friedmanniella sp.]
MTSAATEQTASRRLHLTRLGESGPRVVFLHGLFGQGKNWTTLARSLGTEARVTLLDLPDHGRSAWSEQLSYPAMAQAVGDALAEQSEGEPSAVVGHSMGGKVAMALALLRPAQVERLCVVDVAPVPTGPMSSFATYVEGMRAVDLEHLSDRAAAEAVLTPYVPDPVIRSFLLQNLRRDGDRWRWQMNLRLLGDELSEVAGWPDLRADPWRAEPYPGPVLWVGGSESDYVRPEHAPAMRALFPRVQSLTVKGAGHWVHADQPAVFAAVMRRFLHL